MKTVKITIHGDILAVDYCSQLYEFAEDYNLICAWEKITSLTVDDGEENLVKNKGKYIVTRTYLHDMFSRIEPPHPFPLTVHTRTYYNQRVEYIIQLQDGEEFDIKKLQLMKTVEFDTSDFGFFIFADFIMYDGNQIDTYDTECYCPEEKMYNEFEIEGLVNF
jgi:hypothetical protein